MDFTKQYVDMCLGATKIQSLRGIDKWINGDFYVDDIILRPTTPVDHVVFEDSSDEPMEMYHPIFLPRQDQLQDMLEWKHQSRAMLVNMTNWCNDGHCISKCDERAGMMPFGESIETYHMKDWSPEQLWLSYIMYKKYNKQWIDNNWRVV